MPEASLPGRLATGQTALRVDLGSGQARLTHLGGSLTLRGRWDGAFLKALMDGEHRGASRAADVALLEQALRAQGLAAPLSATQWGRIVDRLRAALLRLDASGALARKLCHAPRAKTTGPWWWHSEARTEADAAQVPLLATRRRHSAWANGAGAAGAEVPAALALALDPHGDTGVRLLSRFKRAMEAVWKADLKESLVLLSDGPDWGGESPALASLRALRRAETLSSLGRMAAARQVLARTRRALADPLLARLFQPHLDVAEQRLDYARDPVGNYAELRLSLRQSLRHALRQPSRHPSAAQSTASALPDNSDWAEQFHLLALCERRVLQHEMPWQSQPQDGAAHVAPLLRAAHAALLLFLLVRNYDKTQHVCANLAYAHQKLAPDLGHPHWQMAVRWHALSFGLHASFGGAESSAWEFIYLGELWLDSPQAREACRTPGLDASWGDDTPERLSFYDRACRIAEQIGEPRQLAYTLLNRQRFAAQMRTPRARDDSLRRLKKLLQAHPELERLLLRENYSLPRQARRA